MPQRPHLFDDTVAGNIALGRPGASPADIRRGRSPGRRRRVHQPPRTTATRPPSASAGLRLSSGQRQKIALARAFLRDAPLLLLDEPAAHLDPFSASQVQEAIAALSAGRTVIHVTHRPPLLPPGARLLTLDDGRLVAPPAAVPGPSVRS